MRDCIYLCMLCEVFVVLCGVLNGLHCCRQSAHKHLRRGLKCWRMLSTLLKHGPLRCIITFMHNLNVLAPSHFHNIQTYRPCYEEGGELNKRVKYHILNSTGVSSLKWPEHNGMYIFAATVVARDYRSKNFP